MSRISLVAVMLVVSALNLSSPNSAYAQAEGSGVFAGEQEIDTMPLLPDEFYRARVLEVVEHGTRDKTEEIISSREVTVKLLNGPQKGEVVIIEDAGLFTTDPKQQKLRTGEKLVVIRQQGAQGVSYGIVDKYRIPALALVASLFLALGIFFGRIRGLTSILGLGFSVFVLAAWVVPRIISGHDPLITGMVGILVIATVSIYLAHGFRKWTTVALLSTFVTLGISAGLAFLFVYLGKLAGAGSEAAFYIQIGSLQEINLRGLLLAGIMIGSLGVLDDITVGQTATLRELKAANPALGFKELYRRGLSVGREHIASLVNTLALAYVGASLPLFVLFSADSPLPTWALINSELIAEEVVRTLVGSTALIFAVPIATALAAWYFGRSLRS
ncbi:YibE/F family protein [Candidatus Uhrbacteria bacterium]|nr:YibE/F family protein [Candidatus Uhrbacteria bacterium]